MINYIDILVTEHHELYMRLFKTHLKPKHHFLVHYARALRNLGPLCQVWGMRFEGKNLETKFVAQTCRSRIYICKSLALRHMFSMASQVYFLRKFSNEAIEMRWLVQLSASTNPVFINGLFT